MKKGRRSRNRCENERLLFNLTASEIEAEDEIVAQESRSHFTALLENDGLMRRYLNEDDEDDEAEDEPRIDANISEAEAAFKRIGVVFRRNLANKHVARGIITGLEEEIRGHFEADPASYLLLDGLSSYERLLAHACSAYHSLVSHSFDFDDGEKKQRKLKVENPKRRFRAVDPKLADFLIIRKDPITELAC